MTCHARPELSNSLHTLKYAYTLIINLKRNCAYYFHMTNNRNGILNTYFYFVYIGEGKSMYKYVTVVCSSLVPHHHASLCLKYFFSDVSHCHKFHQHICWAPGNERLSQIKKGQWSWGRTQVILCVSHTHAHLNTSKHIHIDDCY